MKYTTKPLQQPPCNRPWPTTNSLTETLWPSIIVEYSSLGFPKSQRTCPDQRMFAWSGLPGSASAAALHLAPVDAPSIDRQLSSSPWPGPGPWNGLTAQQ
jgi:hypothetical protein